MAFSQTLFMLILVLHVSIAMGIEAISNSTISKPGCPSNCGNVSIPYPFGIGRGCYRDKAFEIICDGNTSNKPYLGYISREVLHLSLKELRVRSQITKLCYNSSTGMINSTSFNGSTNLGYDLPRDGPFTYSTTRNKFTALGCDIFAFISYYNGDKLSGCGSMCPVDGNIDIHNSSCLGVGCCSVAIPTGGVKEFKYKPIVLTLKVVLGCPTLKLAAMHQSMMVSTEEENHSSIMITFQKIYQQCYLTIMFSNLSLVLRWIGA
ncbi:hypothetical protein Syun_018237 [Stephania yunnanensis]|uniref:Wall-associated receptor kinase galacturonan-binding domain-containing protein n=1 Tax=Stephania yunnanensis TaxID=152371 RepID=A0AAP0ISJ1_9MAGN